MFDYALIGKRIRRHRLDLDLSQEQLSSMANISLSFLGHIERGTRKMSIDTLHSLAVVLECSADELLGLETAKSIKSAQQLLELAQQLADGEKLDTISS